jgi:hypothetical protein
VETSRNTYTAILEYRRLFYTHMLYARTYLGLSDIRTNFIFISVKQQGMIGWTKMQDDRHCKACGHLLAMHDREGCTATFPKPCKCGGAIK